MKSPYAVNLHNAVTVLRKRLGKRVAQLSFVRMSDVCAALRVLRIYLRRKRHSCVKRSAPPF
jgi:hypothetical protein